MEELGNRHLEPGGDNQPTLPAGKYQGGHEKQRILIYKESRREAYEGHSNEFPKHHTGSKCNTTIRTAAPALTYFS